MPGLFDPTELALLMDEYGPPHDHALKMLETVERLRARRADGTLRQLSETRVEQSFNEVLFGEVLGYRTLFRDGEGPFHLNPKGYHPESGRYDDFELGFFGSATGSTRVLAELKSPDASLDEPQRGRKNPETPVEQAFATARSVPFVEWVVVSNFEELRLYWARDPTRYERILLGEIELSLQCVASTRFSPR